MQRFNYLATLILLLVCGRVYSQSSDFETIIYRIDSLEKAKTNFLTLDARVETYLKGQQIDGSWATMNYDDRSTNYNAAEHVPRLLEYAIAFTSPQSRYFGDTTLYNGLVKGLDFWYAKDPQPLDRFYTQARFPTALGKVLCVMRNASRPLPGQLETNIVTNRINRGKPGTWTGDNKQVTAFPYTIRGAFRKDASEISTAVGQMYSVIRVYAPYVPGLQYDNSYLGLPTA